MKKYLLYRNLLVVSLISLIIIMAGCTINTNKRHTEPTPPSVFVTYTDQSNGFSISYPQDWPTMPEELLGDAIIGFSTPEEYGNTTNITVSHIDLPSEITVRAFFDISTQNLETLEGYTLVSKQELIKDSIPAIKHLYTINREGSSLEVTQLLMVVNKSGWVVTCTCAAESFDLFEPTFNIIFDSFQLSDSRVPVSLPVIDSFISSRGTINPGQPVTLTWNVSNATTVTIHPNINNVDSTGTIQLYPPINTAYTLTATNGAGSSTSTINITVTPTDNTIVGSDPVTGRNPDIGLTWEQLCLSSQYQVQIAKDPGFTLMIFDSGTVAPGSSTSPALLYQAGGILEAGHKYYWRVRVRQAATGQSIRSPWSEVKSLTISAGFPVTNPYHGVQLFNPTNNCIGCPAKSIPFTWSSFKGANKYKFILARDAELTDVIVMAEVTSTSYVYEGVLDYNTAYFWQVMALDPAQSDPSATFNFITEAEPPVQPPIQPPATEAPAIPSWVWAIICIGSILIAVILVIIFRVRQV